MSSPSRRERSATLGGEPSLAKVSPLRTPPAEPVPLVVRDVTFGYRRSADPVLHGVDFSCPPGTLTLIEGQNGSGKSTLLELCAGLRRPWSGEVRLDARVAYLPQSLDSLQANLTGREHARLFGVACGLGVSSALEGVTGVVERLGMPGADLRQRVGDLSGGTAQKLSLALCLLDPRARVYLLDEPYAGFDTESLLALIALFAELTAGGRTIVMVNHLTDPRLPVGQTITLPPRERA